MVAKAITKMVCFTVALVAFIMVFTPVSVVNAYDPFTDTPELKDDSLTIGAGNFKAKNIINTTLQVLGSLAIVVVIVGGIIISVANGNPSQMKTGRDTILYAVVGLVVAMASYAIINFVISFNW